MQRPGPVAAGASYQQTFQDAPRSLQPRPEKFQTLNESPLTEAVASGVEFQELARLTLRGRFA